MSTSATDLPINLYPSTAPAPSEPDPSRLPILPTIRTGRLQPTSTPHARPSNPHRSSPTHRQCLISRGFLPGRFSDAGRRSKRHPSSAAGIRKPLPKRAFGPPPLCARRENHSDLWGGSGMASTGRVWSVHPTHYRWSVAAPSPRTWSQIRRCRPWREALPV
jgi:hypothetical protein